jgi:hypothetical protein
MQDKKKKEKSSSFKKFDSKFARKMQLYLTQAQRETCQLTHFATTFEDSPSIATSNIGGILSDKDLEAQEHS